MSKVFIVTTGEYSDYRIVGVFSSREKALEFCPAAASDAETKIEEYAMDIIDRDAADGEEGTLQTTYRVYLKLDSGDLDIEDHRDEIHPAGWCQASSTSVPQYGTANRVTVLGESTISRDHALKLAAEHRQLVLRQTV